MSTKTSSRQALEQTLRGLIEQDRSSLEQYLTEVFTRQVYRFLSRREPNLTIEEVYGPQEDGSIVLAVTDYLDAYKEFRKQNPDTYRRKPEERPHWEVQLLPDWKEKLAVLVKREAEFQIQTFLTRAIEKLEPIADACSDLTFTHCEGGFLGGTWIGNISLSSETVGISATVRLKIITNFSVHGKPYGQYPCTFHNVVLPGQRTEAMVPVEDLWKAVGYVKPEAPKGPIKRWRKLVNGCVVRHDGEIFFVKSASKARKAGIPEDAEQLARIEVQCGNGRYFYATARAEFADGSIQRHEFTGEILVRAAELYQAYQFNKATDYLKDQAFLVFFRKPPTKGE